MVREIITVNVGECGVQLGRRVWDQYNVEHGISSQGVINESKKQEHDFDSSFLTFYEETASGVYVPRNLVIDLDPDTIERDIQRQHAQNPFPPEFHIHGKEDAANNFARGFYSVGKTIIDRIEDLLRKLVDNCDNPQGFIMNHSVGGGTGSGLGVLILERIAVDYRKKMKLGAEVYPFNNHLSKCVVEPYNALLATHRLLDHTDLSFLFDNRRVYSLCQSKLDIAQPTYNDMNTLIAKIMSLETGTLRYESELSVEFYAFLSGLHLPFPRLHFLTTSLAPLVNNMEVEKVLITHRYSKVLVDGFVRFYYPFLSQSSVDHSLQFEPPLYVDLMELIYRSYSFRYIQYNKTYYDINCINDLCEMCCDSEYFMIECDDFDVEKDKYMMVTLNCAGDIRPKEINRTVQDLKKNKHVVFVSWAPTGFKIGLNKHALPRIDEDDKIAPRKRMVQMMGNNSSISRFFSNRISKIYDKMYSRRAYVHWYIAAGMEEGEFAEAREDLGFLEKDYLEILEEQATDETESSSYDPNGMI
eukprot:944401_1